MRKEILVGKIVTLKMLRAEYFQQYYAMFSPTVRKILGLPKEQTFEDLERFLKEKLFTRMSSPSFFYCIFDNAKNKLIGAIDVREPSFAEGQIGCWLNENFWGGGRYQEALALVLAEYFAATDHSVVNAHINTKNMRSLKAHEKHGFKVVRAFEKDGATFYELIYKK